MPNQRRAGQVFIGCQADAQLVRDLDKARGWKERSQFIREAIAEKLQRAGIAVPERLIHPPPRANIIQIGDGNRAAIAAERPPRYKVKRKRK